MAKMKFDFSGVTDTPVIEPGKYLAKVMKITKEEGQNYPYLKWDLLIMSGKAKGLHINHITTLKPEGLFSLRNTLIACGLNVPKAAVTLDIDKLIGKTLGIETSMRKGNDGNEYPNVKSVMTVDKLEEKSAEPVDDLDIAEDLSFEKEEATELSEDDL